MSRLLWRVVATKLGIGIAITCVALPAWTRVERFPVGAEVIRFGAVEFEVPDGWTAIDDDRVGPTGRAIRFAPPGDMPFVLLVSLVPIFKPAGTESRCQEMRPLAEKVRQKLLETAEEKEVPLHAMRGGHACGFYASATDRTVTKPTLSDFKYGTQGYAVDGQAMAVFTVLTNLKDPPELAKSLALVGSAKHVGLPESARTAAAATRLALPGKDWGLSVNLDGYEIEAVDPAENRVGLRLLATRKNPSMTITIFLEPDTRSDTARGYRRWYRENHLPPIRGSAAFDIEESERNSIPILEYSRKIPGTPETLRNMNGFLVHDGVWIDVHLSKVPYAQPDRQYFNVVFDSLRLDRGDGGGGGFPE